MEVPSSLCCTALKSSEETECAMLQNTAPACPPVYSTVIAIAQHLLREFQGSALWQRL